MRVDDTLCPIVVQKQRHGFTRQERKAKKEEAKHKAIN